MLFSSLIPGPLVCPGRFNRFLINAKYLASGGSERQGTGPVPETFPGPGPKLFYGPVTKCEFAHVCEKGRSSSPAILDI